jgi:hypothetical protein
MLTPCTVSIYISKTLIESSEKQKSSIVPHNRVNHTLKQTQKILSRTYVINPIFTTDETLTSSITLYTYLRKVISNRIENYSRVYLIISCLEKTFRKENQAWTGFHSRSMI